MNGIKYPIAPKSVCKIARGKTTVPCLVIDCTGNGRVIIEYWESKSRYDERIGRWLHGGYGGLVTRNVDVSELLPHDEGWTENDMLNEWDISEKRTDYENSVL